MGEEMRAALEEAVDSSEELDDNTPKETAPAPSEQEAPEDEGESPVSSEDTTEISKTEDETPEAMPEGEPEEPLADKENAKLSKAPVNWSPTARESWKSLPEEVKNMVHKRETEVNRALMNGSENRKTGEEFNNLAGKYSAVLAAEGVSDPVQGFEMVLQTMSTLRMGNPEQKARKIAEVISAYGVDITTLDNILVGTVAQNGQAPEMQQNSQFDKILNERLAPVNELMARISGADAEREEKVKENAANDVHTFGASAEFYDDVRMDMADLMDMSANRNQSMSLQQAYDKACTLNPEIASVMATRSIQTSLPNKLKAASSITGNQGGKGGGNADKSMRATIEQLMNEG